MPPKINDRVTHVTGSDRTGVVTAICERASGKTYGVTWPDLTERWHAKEELKKEEQPKIIRLQP